MVHRGNLTCTRPSWVSLLCYLSTLVKKKNVLAAKQGKCTYYAGKQGNLHAHRCRQLQSRPQNLYTCLLPAER